MQRCIREKAQGVRHMRCLRSCPFTCVSCEQTFREYGHVTQKEEIDRLVKEAYNAKEYMLRSLIQVNFNAQTNRHGT